MESAILAGFFERRDFARALYGATILAINNLWYGEFNDCPDEWYERQKPDSQFILLQIARRKL